jgi:hypothetical protein
VLPDGECLNTSGFRGLPCNPLSPHKISGDPALSYNSAVVPPAGECLNTNGFRGLLSNPLSPAGIFGGNAPSGESAVVPQEGLEPPTLALRIG